MNKFFVLVMALFTIITGCAADATSDSTVHGDWLYVNSSGTSGVGASLKEDGTYVVTVLRLTSPTTALASVETGTYAVTPTSLTFEAKKSTCSGASREPQTYEYSLSGDKLTLLLPEGILSFERNPHGGAGSNFIIEFGCFRSGEFVPAPLSSIE